MMTLIQQYISRTWEIKHALHYDSYANTSLRNDFDYESSGVLGGSREVWKGVLLTSTSGQQMWFPRHGMTRLVTFPRSLSTTLRGWIALDLFNPVEDGPEDSRELQVANVGV